MAEDGKEIEGGKMEVEINKDEVTKIPGSEKNANLLKKQPGILSVYTGNGKGKTTAALGMVYRALGWDLPVSVIQFVKGKWRTGERILGERWSEQYPEQLIYKVMGKGFTWDSDDLSRDKEAAIQAWETAANLITKGLHHLVVLDEITYVINYGFVSEQAVIDVFEQRPAHVNVVVTGRNCPQKIMDLADLVTEMAVVKHPYKKGRPALRGVDF